MPSSPYGGKWPRIRIEVLERDGYRCQIRLRGCTGRATDVDHIIPWRQGGAWFDKSNLRGACQNCNNARIGAGRSRRWERGGTVITLVIGPSDDALAYVREHARPGDLVLDEQLLSRGLSAGGADVPPGPSANPARALRNRLLDQLRRAELAIPRAWITSPDPSAAGILPAHQVVRLGEPSTATPAAVVAEVAVPSREW